MGHTKTLKNTLPLKHSVLRTQQNYILYLKVWGRGNPWSNIHEETLASKIYFCGGVILHWCYKGEQPQQERNESDSLHQQTATILGVTRPNSASKSRSGNILTSREIATAEEVRVENQ